MAESKPFKLWFDAALVRTLAERVAAVEPRFDRASFVRRARRGLDALEMTGRVVHIADALHAALPGSSRERLAALVRSLPPPSSSAEGITGYGFSLWPYGEVIGRHGLDDWDASFAAMIELTQRFSAEFAVRPFLAEDADRALDRLERLVAHPSVHVRRWVSEGTRSRLPWGKRVPALEERSRAKRRLKLLTALRHDPEAYVRRSVANHLQDVLKDDRALAFPVLAAWAREGRPSTDWIAKHAARGLLKAHDPEALALFGHGGGEVIVERFSARPTRVAVGGDVELVAQVKNPGPTPVRVRLDYLLVSPGARERPTKKTFRFADVELAPGEAAARTIRHRFLHRTIRTIRPGEHRICLKANGQDGGEVVVKVRGE